MSRMRFSIIVVTLNAGEELINTVKSCINQTFADKEIVIKDGMSTDGSLEKVKEIATGNVQIISEPDKSIYDGMNRAIKDAKGGYLIFMNAGDSFADDKVLAHVAKHMIKHDADIYYGNMYRRGSITLISYPEKMTEFGLYRNVPCHQVCFYSRRLFEKKAYDLKYPIRADYEHFLRSVYEYKAVLSHIDIPVCIYEGEGFSERKDNKAKSMMEHREITSRYMGIKTVMYRGIMIITLQPLREKIAGSKAFSGIYQKIKTLIYKVIK